RAGADLRGRAALRAHGGERGGGRGTGPGDHSAPHHPPRRRPASPTPAHASRAFGLDRGDQRPLGHHGAPPRRAATAVTGRRGLTRPTLTGGAARGNTRPRPGFALAPASQCQGACAGRGSWWSTTSPWWRVSPAGWSPGATECRLHT